MKHFFKFIIAPATFVAAMLVYADDAAQEVDCWDTGGSLYQGDVDAVQRQAYDSTLCKAVRKGDCEEVANEIGTAGFVIGAVGSVMMATGVLAVAGAGLFAVGFLLSGISIGVSGGCGYGDSPASSGTGPG